VEFSTSAHGNVKPTARIVGAKTELNGAYGVAVNAANQPITDNGSSNPVTLVTYAAGAHGDVAPRHSISGTNTTLNDPGLLSLDARGNIWLGSFNNDSAEAFGPTQTGNATAQQDIVGASTDFEGPLGAAAFGTWPGPPTSLRSHHTKTTLHLAWKAPHVTGGAVLGYVVRSQTKSGHWTTVATTTKRTFTKHHAKPRLAYDVEAFNDKGYSNPTRTIRPKV
jgi:hypothetical protein